MASSGSGAFGDQLGDEFHYHGHEINLLDTPGHQDFPRILPGSVRVDSAAMSSTASRESNRRPQADGGLPDANTPILTFINSSTRKG